MDGFFQAIACVLVAVVLYALLSRYGMDMTVLLSLAVCAMVLAAAIGYLKPVMELVETLQDMSQLDPSVLNIVLKTLGVGLTAQFCSLICSDAGNSALAKSVELLASAVIIWMSIPLITQLLELVSDMAGNL